MLNLFTISYASYDEIKGEITVIGESTATKIFTSYMRAINIQEVTMCDGETGEVVMQWLNGKFEVLNRFVV